MDSEVPLLQIENYRVIQHLVNEFVLSGSVREHSRAKFLSSREESIIQSV